MSLKVKEQTQGTHLTSYLLNCNKGNISIIAISLLGILSLFLTINIHKSLRDHQVLKFQYKSYLCAKYTLKQTEFYYRYMSILNKSIVTGFWSQFIPIPGVSAGAKSVKKAAKLAQKAYHISYLKQIASNPYCSWKNTANLVINPPVETTKVLGFKRNLDETVRFKKRWTFYLTFPAPEKLSKLESLLIRVKIKTKKKGFLTGFSAKTKQIDLKAFQHLKDFVGSQSWQVSLLDM